VAGSRPFHRLASLLGQLGELAAPGGTYKVTQSNIKFFLSEYHSQNPIAAAIELSRQVRPEEIDAITVHTYWFTWSEIGSEPEKWHPTNRESADHSLPFILAAVLIDGDGVVRARGLVNTREHLESLFEARAQGVASVQEYVKHDSERQRVA